MPKDLFSEMSPRTPPPASQRVWHRRLVGTLDGLPPAHEPQALDRGQLSTQYGDELAEEKPAKIAGPPQRRQVD